MTKFRHLLKNHTTRNPILEKIPNPRVKDINDNSKRVQSKKNAISLLVVFVHKNKKNRWRDISVIFIVYGWKRDSNIL